MNLYLRLVFILLKVIFADKIKVLDESRLLFRALPTDCDINLHMTNSRYLSFMDLGRAYLLGQLRLLPQLYKRRWGPIVQAAELTYLKPVMIGQRFILVTRLLYWDDKYFYIEQRFLAGAQVCAIATVKGLFIKQKRKIPTAEIVALFDEAIVSPLMPEFIKSWQTMSDLKKDN